jgi:hypothetical protein
MNAYLQKAINSDYETYIEFLQECVHDRIDSEGIGLQEAAEAVVEDALEQLQSDTEVFEKFMASANELVDEPFEDDFELEQHMVDELIKEIHEYELYTAKKTGTLPDSKRLN